MPEVLSDRAPCRSTKISRTVQETSLSSRSYHPCIKPAADLEFHEWPHGVFWYSARAPCRSTKISKTVQETSLWSQSYHPCIIPAVFIGFHDDHVVFSGMPVSPTVACSQLYCSGFFEFQGAQARDTCDRAIYTKQSHLGRWLEDWINKSICVKCSSWYSPFCFFRDNCVRNKIYSPPTECAVKIILSLLSMQ